MILLFKYLFAKIYLFYRDTLHVRTRIHLYSSFVLSLILFANIFVLINLISYLFFDEIVLVTGLQYYIYAGNAVMLAVLIIVSSKRRYNILISQMQSLPESEKARLTVIAQVYVWVSLITLVPFIAQVFQIV